MHSLFKLMHRTTCTTHYYTEKSGANNANNQNNQLCRKSKSLKIEQVIFSRDFLPKRNRKNTDFQSFQKLEIRVAIYSFINNTFDFAENKSAKNKQVARKPPLNGAYNLRKHR